MPIKELHLAARIRGLNAAGEGGSFPLDLIGKGPLAPFGGVQADGDAFSLKDDAHSAPGYPLLGGLNEHEQLELLCSNRDGK